VSVILQGSCPPMAKVFTLGRECGAVYALLWEDAFKDATGKKAKKPLRDLRRKGVHYWKEGQDLRQGGVSKWSVKGISRQCGMGKTTVIKALKKLLDEGYIQYAGWAWGNGARKRCWRVTHPDQLEAVRHAISVMGLPSLKYNDKPATYDPTEPPEGETWTADLDGNVWSQDDGERGDHEVEWNAEFDACYGEREEGGVLVSGSVQRQDA